jgi:hypothetical protein
MPTNRIPRKLFRCHPKQEEKDIGHQTYGSINLSNPKIGTRIMAMIKIKCFCFWV